MRKMLRDKTITKDWKCSKKKLIMMEIGSAFKLKANSWKDKKIEPSIWTKIKKIKNPMILNNITKTHKISLISNIPSIIKKI